MLSNASWILVVLIPHCIACCVSGKLIKDRNVNSSSRCGELEILISSGAGSVLLEVFGWMCVILVRFMFWEVSMRRYLLLDGFDVETNDLDLVRCGGLCFWKSPSGDVWFW